MKRFIFAVVLFAVVLGGGGLFQWMLGNFGEQMQAHCAAIERYAKEENWTALDGQVQALEKFWDKKETALTYIADHAHLNIITAALGELQIATDACDGMEALLANARMRSEASAIVEDASFRPENIF